MDFIKAIVLFWFALNVIGAEYNVDNFDGYWQQRAMEANLAANRSYHPNPEEITQSLNLEVNKFFESSNSSRRDLLGHRSKGPCTATNPIDRCWRCDPNWAKNRKKLADCVLGFGRKARGGKAGRFYVVTDPSDRDIVNPKPGTLRHAVIQPEPLWIIFKRSMVIKLSQELIMTSDKTVDARGANVHISNGAQITLQFVRNIIIHGLHIHDSVPAKGGMIRDSKKHVGRRMQSDGDAISMFEASDIWIDHISMSNCKDGLIDAVMGSTGITISNCHLTNHNDVMLFGASNTHIKDKRMQITLAFNHFGRGLVQRMPRVRFGFVHVVNNQYSHWIMYAIGGSSNPTILSEGNRFTAPPNRACKEVTKREYAPKSVWKNWNWRSEGDLLLNGATFLQSGVNVKRRIDRRYMITAKPGKFAARLARYSGALACFEHKPC